MKRVFHILLASALLASLLTSDIFACTTFCLKNRTDVMFGKNYDWTIGDGMIFLNKRGVSKMSSEEENPVKWVSKHGSVTFNQYGWESPSGGMNEEGLVIELMWLDDTQYPAPDERPVIGVLEWIQFHLDTASTAEDVVRNAEAVRISSPVKLHYLVSDRNGNTAAIEFLEGRLVAHSGDKLPYRTLSNNTYTQSIDHAKKARPATSESSLDRFSRAAARSREFETTRRSEKDAVDYAFETLANVAQKHSTQWSIVYDQRRGRIYWRTKKRNELKSIDTTALDYSCGTSVKILNIDIKVSGDVTKRFRPYNREANRDLIERAYGGTDFLKDVPSSVRDRSAEFPEKFVCAANSPVTRPVDPRSLIATGVTANYPVPIFPLYHVFMSRP